MVLDQLVRERDRFFPVHRRKPPFNQASEKDRLELQPLSLVQGRALARVRRCLALRNWGLLPRLDQHREIRDEAGHAVLRRDRKSTRLNSSHSQISYAGFCLKKKK